MRTGRYLTIQRAFRDYNKNKKALSNYPYPYAAGVDYSKPRVTPDNTKNGSEQMVLSVIDKKLDLERFVELVDKTIEWFRLEENSLAYYFYMLKTTAIESYAEDLRDLESRIRDIANDIDNRLYDFDRMMREHEKEKNEQHKNNNLR